MLAVGRAVAVAGAFALAALGMASGASGQLRLPPARAPCSVLSGRPCHPSFCSVFHRGPCFPDYGIPVGENLQLTIVSTDTAPPPSQEPTANPQLQTGETDAGADESKISTIRAMFAALRACWVPPPKDKAKHGMQYTLRFAFKRDGSLLGPPRRTYSSHDAPAGVRDAYGDAADAAIKRCTPLHFSDRMGEAITGRPIAVRFVDNRTIDNARKAPP
jgi:hypothetical protein